MELLSFVHSIMYMYTYIYIYIYVYIAYYVCVYIYIYGIEHSYGDLTTISPTVCST